MKFKVGEIVSCEVETRKNGTKAIVSRFIEEEITIEIKQFQIIHIAPCFPESEHNMYTLLIPDDYLGWHINDFHIKHQDIDPKLKGKKFWDLTEEYIEKIKDIKK